MCCYGVLFFFSSRRRHTRFDCDWSSDVCSSDLSLREFLPDLHMTRAPEIVPPGGRQFPVGADSEPSANAPNRGRLLGRSAFLPRHWPAQKGWAPWGAAVHSQQVQHLTLVAKGKASPP